MVFHSPSHVSSSEAELRLNALTSLERVQIVIFGYSCEYWRVRIGSSPFCPTIKWLEKVIYDVEDDLPWSRRWHQILASPDHQFAVFEVSRTPLLFCAVVPDRNARSKPSIWAELGVDGDDPTVSMTELADSVVQGEVQLLYSTQKMWWELDRG